MSISRRNVIKAAALAPVTPALARFAGPFGQDEAHLVPADKKLSPEWVRSLTERGKPEWVQGADLRFIGMPVGGFFAGTVYLGGDGQLWNWDIFNKPRLGAIERPNVRFMGQDLNAMGGANYVDPVAQVSPFDLTFSLGGVPLNAKGDWTVRFLGQYPVGTVVYGAPGKTVELTAFSPFIPLEAESSSFPATILTYKVTNTGQTDINTEFSFRLEHPVVAAPDLLGIADAAMRGFIHENWQGAQCWVEKPFRANPRQDITVQDWESGTYGDWKTAGTAFGDTPVRVADLPAYMGPVNAGGRYTVNTHNNRQGEDVVQADQHTGTLTSPLFTAQRDYLVFKMGGGNHPNETCVNLIVNGEVVATATGRNENWMRWTGFDLRPYAGKAFQIEVVDRFTGGWGQVSIDEIVQSDSAPGLKDLPDHRANGSLCVAVRGTARPILTTKEDGKAPIGTYLGRLALKPGESKTIDVIVAWNYPNLVIDGMQGQKRWYASKWQTAADVATAVAQDFHRLTSTTLLWRDTWYDSTLPYWLLDRTMVNTSILATNTCHRFASGRYWFWEGVGCCHGTCTHVWGYTQAVGRLFPEIERRLRTEVDFGLAWRESGAVDYRAEFGRSVAHDGQSALVLRTYRDHLMSKDTLFLKGVWPKVKKSLEYLVAGDKDQDGLLEGEQYNTLDASWYGPMAWLSGLFLAAVRAGEAMALAVGDRGFADQCRILAEKGKDSMVSKLFDGEYFVHIPDPAHPEANATGKGCHIDQLYGQYWAKQVGLPDVVPHEKAVSALKALYKYNFAPDVGVYRSKMTTIKGGRWYAAPGEAGLIMTTFPKGGADHATGKGRDEWAAMYFNECMSGFEYQAAAAMVHTGLVTEGLAVTRAIHDRYSPSKRNPYNEVECSDHYGRAMASYGVYVAVTGLKMDGPAATLTFDPAITPDQFKCAFVNADGWGTYTQSRKGTALEKNLLYRHKTS